MSNTGSIIWENTDSYTHLFFFYSIADNKVFFSSLPLEEFFEFPVDLRQSFPFLSPGTTPAADLEKEWRHCLQLKEKETGNFGMRVSSTDAAPVLFWFDVARINSPDYDNTPTILFSVRKQMINQISSAKSKTSGISQKDYAEFIDIAAHDLDAPLRKTSLLLDRLVHKNKTEPGSDLRDYFNRIQTSITEMRALVDNLASWSALNSATISDSGCDMTAIVNETVDELRHKTQDKKISVLVSPLPVLKGTKMQYKLLFQNLLQNAICFSKKEEEVKIKISAESLSAPEKTHWQLPHDQEYSKITVTDDGIGFSQEYAEKIFRPFIRLHGKSEYPGTGMGLAICRKIIENHGGIIYAESNENKGATFTLILPQSL